MSYTRDRLAASRAQREQQSVELSNLPHPPEATTYTTSHVPIPPGGLSDLAAFLAEDTSIQEGIQQVRGNVSQIAALRTQSLNAIDDSTAAEASRIDALTSETRALLQQLKDRIRAMENTPSKQDAQLRNNRLAVLRTKFMEAIQDYQREEQESRAKAKQRVERQVLIVKPDATREEIAAAVEGGGQQIFAEALTTSTRYGESRAAYREVQERQEDIKRVERTLAELAQLFSDMAVMIEQQDAVIKNVEQTAQVVDQDTSHALGQTEIAVKHARSYRRGRWICFFIFLTVICILALVLGLTLGLKNRS
ncbi:syntaxin-like protein [Agrocybe pediades]|nr:syntaxin-like protein [Agrocybe pediades]